MRRTFTLHYLLVEHVLIRIDDYDKADFAVAWRCDSPAEARAVAIAHTESDEAVGFRLNAPVRSARVVVEPDVLAESYRDRIAVGPALRALLVRARQGVVA